MPKKRKPEKSDEDETARKSRRIDSKGRAGRIEKIYLENFMCHSALEINFNLNSNCLTGRNGSGKSAVLTALIIGLGGKARDTNRGASMKAFIKAGQQSAYIEITLVNTGSMAYNPKVFGDRITVIRTFSDTGGNTYRLKNTKGETVSNTYRELVRMTEALNIHVDNPVCILNQDVARTFLNTSDPSKLYVMFMKATNLETVKAQYKAALRNKQQTETSLTAKEKALDELKREVLKWQKKYKSFDKVSEIENKKRELDIEAVWAQINQIEAELKTKDEFVDTLKTELHNLEEMNSNKANRKAALTTSISEAKEALIQIRNEEQANQQRMNEKKTHLNRLQQDMATKLSEINSAKTVISRRETDIKNIENFINNSSCSQANRTKMLEERDEKIKLNEKRQLELAKLLETAETELKQARAAVARKKAEKSTLDQDLEHVVGQIRQRQAKIRTMKSEEHNAVAVYGAQIPRVLQAIQSCKEQFKHLPVGPVGSYIKLKDRRWALAVEDYIGSGLLSSFCVDNHEDAKILSKIFDECCPARGKPTIICSKFFSKVHDYNQNKTDVPNDCTCLIDAMIIKEPIVLNCLIDQLSVETVLLVPSGDRAIQLMSDERRVPRLCTRAITLQGDQFYPDPNYRSYSCRNTNPRFLQVSATQAIRVYEEELRSLTENHEAVLSQTKAVANDVNELIKQLQGLEGKIAKYYKAKTHLQTEIKDLKLQQLPPEQNIEILTDELTEVKKVIESKEKEIKELENSMAKVKEAIKTAERECNSLKLDSKELEKRMKPLLDTINESETALKQVNANARYQAEKIAKKRATLSDAQKQLEEKQKVLEHKLNETKVLGPRVHTNRSIETVLAELNDVKQQLQDVKNRIGDRVAITEAYLQLQAKYNRTLAEIEKVQECLAQVRRSVETRATYYNNLLSYVGLRVQDMFTIVLHIRHFQGNMKIDHTQQKLELVVIPHQNVANNTAGRPQILSGGERSYSTIAFLHALWQVMEYPFYFLDEFDVFMDKVNRRTVMDILMAHAKEHSYLQFVFLTPQDISAIVDDPSITVHKLEDPHRKKVI